MGYKLTLENKIEIIFKNDNFTEDDLLTVFGLVVELLSISSKDYYLISKFKCKEMMNRMIDSIWEEGIN